MRASNSFRTSFLLSTWVSAASHGAVIVAGLWLHVDPAPRTRPRPALDHGENAVTIVWRAPVPRDPAPPAVERPPPDQEPPLDEPEELDEGEEREAVTRAQLDPPEELEQEPEAEPEIDSAPEPPPPEPRGLEPEPIPLTGGLAREAPATRRTTAPAPPEARATAVNALRASPVAPSPEFLEVAREEPPAPGSPGVRNDARLASELAPRYPRSCRRRGHQGTVRLECRLSAAGRVLSARIAASAGCEKLDRAALDAIRPARFEPARIDGEPVEGTVVLPIEFRLR